MLRKWWWLVVLVRCEVVSTAGCIKVKVRDLSSRHHPIVTGWWLVGGWPLSLMECWLSMLVVVQCVVVL